MAGTGEKKYGEGARMRVEGRSVGSRGRMKARERGESRGW